MFGGDDGNSLLTDAALIGTGAYLARQNPNSSIPGVVGTAALYFMYFGIGLLVLIAFVFLMIILFGKRTGPSPPPADTTPKAEATAPAK